MKRFLITALFILFLLLSYPLFEIKTFSTDIQPSEFGDCLIVLGAKIKEDETPDLMMKERVETAAIIVPVFTTVILSGGTLDAKKSEAAVMKDLFLAKGLPGEKFILEEKSTSSYENLAFSKPLLEQAGCTSIDILSHRFHLPRILLTAKRLNIPVHRLIDAKQELPDSNARLFREYKAYLWYWMFWGRMIR